MTGELPPEESKLPATADGMLLAQVYDSPDRTIQEVAPRSLPADDQPREAAQRNRSRPRPGLVTTVTIDRQVLREARRLAEGNLGRLVLRSDGTVYVANSTQHARLIQKDRNFGTSDG